LSTSQTNRNNQDDSSIDSFDFSSSSDNVESDASLPSFHSDISLSTFSAEEEQLEAMEGMNEMKRALLQKSFDRNSEYSSSWSSSLLDMKNDVGSEFTFDTNSSNLSSTKDREIQLCAQEVNFDL
jgi:hypothetical protein